MRNTFQGSPGGYSIPQRPAEHDLASLVAYAAKVLGEVHQLGAQKVPDVRRVPMDAELLGHVIPSDWSDPRAAVSGEY
jgi:hypothetical protein